ncbi:hypothetical protein ACFE04_019833 [Oxalis oulophora]
MRQFAIGAKANAYGVKDAGSVSRQNELELEVQSYVSDDLIACDKLGMVYMMGNSSCSCRSEKARLFQLYRLSYNNIVIIAITLELPGGLTVLKRPGGVVYDTALTTGHKRPGGVVYDTIQDYSNYFI